MKTTALGLLLALCAAAEPLSVKLPPFRRVVLPNGVVLCLMPKPDAPLLSLRAEFRGGAESDPPKLAGLSAVVARLVTHGTISRTADQYASAVDLIGASLDSYVTPQASVLTLDVLPAHASSGIHLLSDAILHPAFREQDVQRQLKRSVDMARSRKDSPDDAIWQYFRSFFFQAPHPYGRPFEGDETTVGHITRAEVQRHYARLYVGRNLIVTAVGPFQVSRMESLLRTAFRNLPSGTRYEWRNAGPPGRRETPRMLLVDKPDVTQTQFVIGFPGIRRTDPDRIPLWLVNNILGGKFTSLLNERLRVQSGLTYGAYSDVEEDRLSGAITIYSYASTRDTRRTIELALHVLRTLVRQGVTAGELLAAKRYVEAAYPPDNLQTAGQLADLLGDLQLYGLGRSEIDGLFARLDRVSLRDADRVLKKYLSGTSPVLVLIGRGRAIRAQFRGRAPDMMEVSIKTPGFPRPAGILRADARSASSPGRRPYPRRAVR